MSPSEDARTAAAPAAEAGSRVINVKDVSAARNAGWHAFGTFWTIAISLLVAPLLIRTLGTESYGILLLIWSVTGLLGLVGFGFGEATLRYIAHYFADGRLGDVNRIMGATLSFHLATCAMVLLSLLLFAPSIGSWFELSASGYARFEWLLWLAALVFGLRTMTQCYAAVPMALQRYDVTTKVGVVQSVVRTLGYVLLALGGFDILHFVIWDAITQAIALIVQAAVNRTIAPPVSLRPSWSLSGLAELSGFSLFSFLTYAFHMMQREGPKMLAGSMLGAAPVAYFGTPDNVSQRLHMVIASGSETLMPRFSANREADVAGALFRQATWSALAGSLVLFVPLAVLLPDFLALWIDPAFAAESGFVGQLVALSYISQGAYAPAATFFRGTGRPSRVTLVIMIAGIVTLVASLLLIPRFGVAGVGYACMLGSIPALFGVIDGWYHMFGRSSTRGLLHIVALPILMAGMTAMLGVGIRRLTFQIGWIQLLVLGGVLAGATAISIGAADLAVGGRAAPTRALLEKAGRVRGVAGLLPGAAR